MLQPRLPSNLFLGLAGPLLFVLFQVQGCLQLDARPESAQNPVGEIHQVSARVDGGGDWIVLFQIIAGPNAGQDSIIDEEVLADCELGDPGCNPEDCLSLDSLEDCFLFNDECQPSCSGSGDGTVTWRYRSNGEPGTDYIAVCGFDLDFLDSSASLAQGDFENFIEKNDTLGIFDLLGGDGEGIADDEIEAEIESFEDAGCDVVTKTWVDSNPLLDRGGRFVGGGLFAGDLQAAERNRERANASAVVAATPRAVETGIRPPSTGDGGLLD